MIALGDGEFDGTVLQALLPHLHWQYVCHAVPNLMLIMYAREHHIGALAPTRGELLVVPSARITVEHYGPVAILAIWEDVYEGPLYLMTYMLDLAAALVAHHKRADIGTFFSDQKSRRFQIQKSHLHSPARRTRLRIGACLAYLWLCGAGRLVETIILAGPLRFEAVSARPVLACALP